MTLSFRKQRCAFALTLIIGILSLCSTCEPKEKELELPIIVSLITNESRNTKLEVMLMNTSDGECFENVKLEILGMEAEHGDRFYKTITIHEPLKLGDFVEKDVHLRTKVRNLSAKIVRAEVYSCDFEY